MERWMLSWCCSWTRLHFHSYPMIQLATAPAPVLAEGHGAEAEVGDAEAAAAEELIIHRSYSCFYFVAWVWASTNQSHLSMPRETSVKMSAVSASSNSSASSIVLRASCPKVE